MVRHVPETPFYDPRTLAQKRPQGQGSTLTEKSQLKGFAATADPLNLKNKHLHVGRYRQFLDEDSSRNIAWESVKMILDGRHDAEAVLNEIEEQTKTNSGANDTNSMAKRCVSLKQTLQTRDELIRNQTNRDWKSDHNHLLDDMSVVKFQMAAEAQRTTMSLQRIIVDEAYEEFGRVEGSWEGYTLMFRNGYENKDSRKPVSDLFQEYCEEVYCKLIWTLIFGRVGWEGEMQGSGSEDSQSTTPDSTTPTFPIKRHWSQFKACSIKVCESAPSFYGDRVYHMHIDGKVGKDEPKNHVQKKMMRMLISVVKWPCDEADRAEEELEKMGVNVGTQVEDSCAVASSSTASPTTEGEASPMPSNDSTISNVEASNPNPTQAQSQTSQTPTPEQIFAQASHPHNARVYGTTDFPLYQPKIGFKNNHEFHSYMQSLYPETGLFNDGLPRPHYEIPEHLIYRAKTGEVLMHRSHWSKDYGCQPIHAEPNPCPDRVLFVWDFANLIQVKEREFVSGYSTTKGGERESRDAKDAQDPNRVEGNSKTDGTPPAVDSEEKTIEYEIDSKPKETYSRKARKQAALDKKKGILNSQPLVTSNKKPLPSLEIPEERIIECMAPLRANTKVRTDRENNDFNLDLSLASGHAFCVRLNEVVDLCDEMLKASDSNLERYPNARGRIEKLREMLIGRMKRVVQR